MSIIKHGLLTILLLNGACDDSQGSAIAKCPNTAEVCSSLGCARPRTTSVGGSTVLAAGGGRVLWIDRGTGGVQLLNEQDASIPVPLMTSGIGALSSDTCVVAGSLPSGPSGMPTLFDIGCQSGDIERVVAEPFEAASVALSSTRVAWIADGVWIQDLAGLGTPRRVSEPGQNIADTLQGSGGYLSWLVPTVGIYVLSDADETPVLLPESQLAGRQFVGMNGVVYAARRTAPSSAAFELSAWNGVAWQTLVEATDLPAADPIGVTADAVYLLDAAGRVYRASTAATDDAPEVVLDLTETPRGGIGLDGNNLSWAYESSSACPVYGVELP